MKMERTECTETLAFKLKKPGNSPKENIRYSLLFSGLSRREKSREIGEDIGRR
jgi:hypothetical protein